MEWTNRIACAVGVALMLAAYAFVAPPGHHLRQNHDA